MRGQAATQATKLGNADFFFVSKPELRILIVYDWIRYIFKISRNRGGGGAMRDETKSVRRETKRITELQGCSNFMV